MRPIRRGDRGAAVAEIAAILSRLDLMPAPDIPAPDTPAPGADNPARSGNGAADHFDAAVELAVRAFQQARGLTADGVVDEESWRALDGARWQLGDRIMYQAMPDPMIGDDVRQLQERLLEMGYDVGRADGVYGGGTARALARFQREVGLLPDGACGPATMNALRRLGRKVVGGRPQWLRESEALRHRGATLVGKRIVVDAGHGGTDPGVVVPDGPMRWSEAELAFDLALRLEGRLAAAGVAVHLTRGRDTWSPDDARADLANGLGADLLISLHLDGHANPAAEGVATYHYGTGNGVSSTVGERLAGLVQREIVARTGLADCHHHPKTWTLLRFTRMPAVRVEVGYLTSPADRVRLIDPHFRDRVVAAIVAAIQRMYLPLDADVPTGSIDVESLRAAVLAASSVSS